jgi:hypothetical protein
MNQVSNPRFADPHLVNWNQLGSPTFTANDGNSQLGCVLLSATGDGVEQLILLRDALAYTLSVAVKGAGGQVTLALLDVANNVAYSNTLSGTSAWSEHAATVALPAAQYTLRLSHAAGSIYVDDVSLAHIPATRQELAQMTHARLGDLACVFELSYGADGDATEGDYTQLVGAALREMGAVDERQMPDVRALAAYQVDEAINRIEHLMMGVLHNRAMLKPISSTTGPVTDQFALLQALEKRMGIVPGQARVNPRGVVMRRMVRE